MLKFGYKPNGESKVFDLEIGASLPPGWSEDVSVIIDPQMRTGDAISEAIGGPEAKAVSVVDEAECVEPAQKNVHVQERDEDLQKSGKPKHDRAAHMRKLWAEGRLVGSGKGSRGGLRDDV